MEFPGPKGFPRDFSGKFDSSNVSRDNVSRGLGVGELTGVCKPGGAHCVTIARDFGES